MVTENERQAFVALTAIPGVGPARLRKLLLYFGSATAAYAAEGSQWAEIEGFSAPVIQNFVRAKQAQRWRVDWDLMEKQGAQLLLESEESYPEALRDLADNPPLIYLRGTLLQSDQKAIAIVGTRQASLYGLGVARQLASDLAASGFTIISGLARGVDTAAHLGALETGRTLAILGSGLDNLYPAENRQLAHRIAQAGALISEFPMSMAPDRTTFPRRNRLVSALSLAVVLVEAPLKSGAMITMGRSQALGRKLFACPGRADQESFRGNHALIKGGKAQLVESAADILAALGEKAPHRISSPAEHQGLSKEEKSLLEAFPVGEPTIDEIAEITGLSPKQLNILLIGLTLKKCIREHPGKVYKKT